MSLQAKALTVYKHLYGKYWHKTNLEFSHEMYYAWIFDDLYHNDYKPSYGFLLWRSL